MNPSLSSDSANSGKMTLSYSVAGNEPPPVQGAQARADQPRVEAVADPVNAPPADSAPQLAPLFTADLAEQYRARWIVVQQGFIDDPRRAVAAGDELVTQVMSSLAGTFADERASLEDRIGASDDAATELLRVALRRYRSFFQRLLTI